jgi:hypothetical protein
VNYLLCELYINKLINKQTKNGADVVVLQVCENELFTVVSPANPNKVIKA